MIIDAHSHVETLLSDDGQESCYGMAARNLDSYLADYAANGVDACFAFGSKAYQLESRMRESNDSLARMRDKEPERLYPWAAVSPAWGEKTSSCGNPSDCHTTGISWTKVTPIIQGISMSGPAMQIVAEEAIDLNVPVTVHDGSPEYCSAIQTAYLARKYPKLKVLSAHSGLRELWPDFIDAVRELPNLHLCLSGPTQWGMQTLYDELGPERLLFGSDGGLGHPAITTAYLRRIDQLNAPQEHKEMILGKNALRFLNVIK